MFTLFTLLVLLKTSKINIQLLSTKSECTAKLTNVWVLGQADKRSTEYLNQIIWPIYSKQTQLW